MDLSTGEVARVIVKKQGVVKTAVQAVGFSKRLKTRQQKVD